MTRNGRAPPTKTESGRKVFTGEDISWLSKSWRFVHGEIKGGYIYMWYRVDLSRAIRLATIRGCFSRCLRDFLSLLPDLFSAGRFVHFHAPAPSLSHLVWFIGEIKYRLSVIFIAAEIEIPDSKKYRPLSPSFISIPQFRFFLFVAFHDIHRSSFDEIRRRIFILFYIVNS